MSDERLRELERRARETGAPDDQAAWLVERVRMGRLERRRLEVAAHAGHEGARLALGTKTLPAPTREWARGLVRPGERELAVVALTAIATRLVEHCQGLPRDAAQVEWFGHLRALLAALGAWRATPTPVTRGAVRDAARERPWGALTPSTPTGQALAAASHVLARTVEAATGRDPGDDLFEDAVGYVASHVRRGLLPDGLVLPAVCADVVAWALADEPARER